MFIGKRRTPLAPLLAQGNFAGQRKRTQLPFEAAAENESYEAAAHRGR